MLHHCESSGFQKHQNISQKEQGGTVTAHCAALFFCLPPFKAILRPCERPWASDVSFMLPDAQRPLNGPRRAYGRPFLLIADSDKPHSSL